MVAHLAIDAHYTPSWLARRIVAAVRRSPHPKVIGDLAAGSGALLHEAEAQFGASTNYLGVDSDSAAMSILKTRNPTWTTLEADVYSTDFGGALGSLFASLDVLLLNPPFSYRGGGGVAVDTGHISGRFSPAVAFLLRAMQFLREDGQCIAILPQNALVSERDAIAVSYLRRTWGLDVLEELPFRSFPGIHARTVVVDVGGRGAHGVDVEADSMPALRRGGTQDVLLVRGTIPMHRVNLTTGGPNAFLHTTGLVRESAGPIQLAIPDQLGRSVEGPFVALPRVGSLTSKKVCIYAGAGRVKLSDCVYALKPMSGSVESLHAEILGAFEQLAERYQGSCARYLTVARLTGLLTLLGFRVVVQGRSGNSV